MSSGDVVIEGAGAEHCEYSFDHAGIFQYDCEIFCKRFISDICGTYDTQHHHRVCDHTFLYMVLDWSIPGMQSFYDSRT